MKLHTNRSDPALTTHLNSLLTLDGEEGLLNTATLMNDPREAPSGVRYDKAICIDFLGLAATALFGRGREDVTPYCFFDKLNALAARAGHLNKQGIIVKVRALLLYPFSSSGQARIQAEMNHHRSSITEPHSNRGGDFFMEQLTEERFTSSSLFTTVHHVISVVDEWRDQLGPNHQLLNYPNRLDVRFSCLHPAGWGLRVNEHFFFDIYPMAKLDRYELRCQNARLPLIEIKLSRDPDAYKVYCDHFRYLWEHDATIDYRDAVHKNDTSRTLRLLPPREVTFEHTAKRILGNYGKADDPEAVFKYRHKAQAILKRFCPPLEPWTTKEVVFIACSWSGAQRAPLHEAEILKELLARDFQDESSQFAPPEIDVRMVRALPGDRIPGTVSRDLNAATIGVIFLSPEVRSGQKDDRATYIARPNVYFELGHLMGRLSSQRILLFQEESVEGLSNLSDIAYVKYEKGKVQLKYLELLDAFRELKLFSSSKSFEEIVMRHMQQLAHDLMKGAITQQDYDGARKYANSKLRVKVD